MYLLGSSRVSAAISEAERVWVQYCHRHCSNGADSEQEARDFELSYPQYPEEPQGQVYQVDTGKTIGSSQQAAELRIFRLGVRPVYLVALDILSIALRPEADKFIFNVQTCASGEGALMDEIDCMVDRI